MAEIIVRPILTYADEAHRSQYGLDGKFDRDTGEWKYGMAKYVRDSLPNATFIGFTGTPIDFDDKSTVEVFGDYIDIYDMTQAVEDGVTVPIYSREQRAKWLLADIWRLPRGSNTPLLCSAASLIPRCLQRGL
mgnify:CR=1 FL=1